MKNWNWTKNIFEAWENSRHFRRHFLLPREMMSEEQAQKFHTDDV